RLESDPKRRAEKRPSRALPPIGREQILGRAPPALVDQKFLSGKQSPAKPDPDRRVQREVGAQRQPAGHRAGRKRDEQEPVERSKIMRKAGSKCAKPADACAGAGYFSVTCRAPSPRFSSNHLSPGVPPSSFSFQPTE